MSDNILSTLLWYGSIFRFRTTVSLSFSTLTNSQMFGMSTLSAILLTTWDLQDYFSQYRSFISVNWSDLAGTVCLLRQDCYYLSHWNVKSLLMYTLVLNSWASLPNLRRYTLVFCYWWWVMINKDTFTSINIRLRCTKKTGDSERWQWSWCPQWGNVDRWELLYLCLVDDRLVDYLPSFLTCLPVPLKFSELQ